jgi:hypothetical protein
MDYNTLEARKTIDIYSHRIGEILVTEMGLKELVGIKYLPKKDEADKVRKVYVFKNSPELFKIFKEFTYKENYRNQQEFPNVKEADKNG